MAIGSFGLPSSGEQATAMADGTATLVSPNWLISTYLVLTFGELLLSPMGISFVSKVAPPKYKGMMMGGWFVATAIGNMLTAVGSWLWGYHTSFVAGMERIYHSVSDFGIVHVLYYEEIG